MCHICENQFKVFAADFDDMLANYRRLYCAGGVRATPAQRCHDFALMLIECDDEEHDHDLTAWHLAVAVERLVALESAGIPT